MALDVRARVVGVRPRKDGSFGVTLGPGPQILWLKTRRPPRLGQLVSVSGASHHRLPVPGGSVIVLEGGELQIESDPYARRVVAPQWIKIVFETMSRPLYPYQMEGAAWLASRLEQSQGSLLCDDPGLGKSTQVLAAVAATKSFPLIIVCPTSVTGSWLKECSFLRNPYRVITVVGRLGAIHPAHIIVISYALLRYREHQLSRLGARCIVFDEAHLLKEPNPKRGHRAAVATRLSEKIPRIIELTGTLLLNRPTEMWRQLHILDRLFWPSFPEFYTRYCTAPAANEGPCGDHIVTSYGKAKRIEELQSLVAPYVLRRAKQDVLGKWLQPIERRQILVDLEPEDRQSYDQVDRDVVLWLRRFVSNERAMRARKGVALSKLTMLRRIAAVGKMRKAFSEYLDQWISTVSRPLVIFAYHVQILAAISASCVARGLRVAKIHGSDTQPKRSEEIALFQSGKADVFVGPLQSAGIGLNLQRGSDILFLERLWTPSLMSQAECRCHRIGQSRIVTATYLDARNTVDEHIARVQRLKQVVIDKVIDSQSTDDDQLATETIQELMVSMAARAA